MQSKELGGAESRDGGPAPPGEHCLHLPELQLLLAHIRARLHLPHGWRGAVGAHFLLQVDELHLDL